METGEGSDRDDQRGRMLVGAQTLAETIHSVSDLLGRLADLLVPDFADLMVAASLQSGALSPAVLRPDTAEARHLLNWVAPQEGGPIAEWSSARLFPAASGLSVIVVPVLGRSEETPRQVLVFGCRVEERSFAAADLGFIEEVVRIVGFAVGQPWTAGAERGQGGEGAENRVRRLQRLTAVLAQALTPAQVGEIVADYAMAALGASVAWVSLVHAPRRRVDLVCTRGLPANVQEQFARLPMEDPSPVAIAARTTAPQWFNSERETLESFPDFEAICRGAGSVALLPLSTGSQRFGGIGLCRDRPGGFSADERGEVLAMTTLGAQALERALRFDTAQQVAATLQRSLMPRTPDVAGIRIRSHYLPAASEAQVGGDWFDVVSLDEGRVGLVVADVAGHGVRAAAVMGQLRTGLRAYLREGHEPGAALERTDVLTQDLSPTLMTTVWCGVLEPASGRLRYANAGHPPPMLVHPRGDVSFLDRESNPPLGVGWSGPFTQTEAELEPAALLVCYTDGLIERQGERLDQGLSRLAEVLRRSSGDLDELDEHLLELPLEVHTDDVAILTISRDPLWGPGASVSV